MLALGLFLFSHFYLLPRAWYSYATRPLWDHSEAPKEHIQHYYAEGVPPEKLCTAHGWTKRETKAEVWDAVRRPELEGGLQEAGGIADVA